MQKIKSAAIRYNSAIYEGYSHFDIKMSMNSKGADLSELEEGFTTTEGRFVDRREAAKIAFAAGQTKRNEIELKSYMLDL